MKRILCILGLAVCVMAMFQLTGCDKTESPVEPIDEVVVDQPVDDGQKVIGAYTSIAWPFGSSENPNDWLGDEGDRTAGGTITACGAQINSHSGADYYARDLRRSSGSTAGKDVYAGFSGVVVKADWTDCYGNCVVIYDHSRRVAVRYAHLQSINVVEGTSVVIRQKIGKVGSTGCGTFSAHLHLVVYENIENFIDGDTDQPVIPTVCDSNYYACRVFFFC